MATTRKAQDLALFLKDELNLRLSKISTPLVVAEVSFDTDQNPLIKIGTGAVGAAGGLLKIKPIEWPLSQNIVGLSEPVYSIHELLFVREAAVAGNTDEVVMNITLPSAARGTRVVFYQSPNGTAPDASQFIDANKKATIEPSLYYGMQASQ